MITLNRKEEERMSDKHHLCTASKLFIVTENLSAVE